MFKRYFSFIKSLKRRTVLTAAGLFVFASMSANVFNWLLNIVAGRVLDTDEFAVYAVFLSILGLLSVPANALATTVSRYYAYFSGKNNLSSIRELILHYKKIALISGALAVSGVFILNDFFHQFLNLPSDRMVIFFAPVAFFLFTSAYFRGILKGKLQFGRVGLMLIIEALSKLILILSGYILELPLLAIAIISLPISWLLSTMVGIVGNSIKSEFKIENKSTISDFSKTESYLFLTNAFFASVGMMLMNSVDILLVKHYFSDSIAGTYALLSLFGKILYFGAGSFIELFTPLTAKSFAENASSRKLFIKLLLLVSAIALPTLAVFLMFSAFIIEITLGKKGLVVLPYFAPYLIATTFLLYTNCFNAFNTAKKHFTSTYLISIMALIQAGLIFVWHRSLSDVLNIVLITQATLFFVVLMYEFFVFPKTPKKDNSSTKISNLLISGIKNIFSKEIVNGKYTSPSILNGYRLMEQIQTPELQRPHLISIYEQIEKTSRPAKILVKSWNGEKKNFAYYALKHEALLFKTISTVVNRNRKNIPSDLKNISVPDVVFYEETSTQIILATEFIDGKLLRSIGSTQQSSVYLDSVRFLQFIGQNMTDMEKDLIGYRTFKHYMLLFPAVLGVAIIRQPNELFNLIKAGLIFLASVPQMNKNQNFTLVHRDLHTNNILVSKKKAWIIDLARCTFTYSLYEYITTLPIEWNNKILRDEILTNINANTDLKQKTLFWGLFANFVIHGLTANNLPKVNIDRYKSALHFITGNSERNSVLYYKII